MKNINYILVTGGLGYLGSHAIIKLLKKNKNIIVVDNLKNSKKKIILNIKKITKRNFIFCKIDIRQNKLESVFKKYKITKVLHFAGLKSVKESEKKPYEYLSNNFSGTLNLLTIMKKYQCRKIIFSSSACVYDEKNKLPFTETSKTNPKSVYGISKLAVELLLKSEFKFDKNPWSIIVFRYFNPIGSHPSGLLNEDPKKIENIIPNLTNSIKKRKIFNVFGGNYSTKDGTCYRDYIHIDDLIDAHVSGLKYLNKRIYEVVNIGTGKCYSVKELILTFSKILNYDIPYKIVGRREGDIPVCYASVKKSKKFLKWKTKKNILTMCRDIIKVI